MGERQTIGLEPLRKHVKYVLNSGYIKNEIPISTLILAHPEHGKTTEVVKFKNVGTMVFSDATAYGILKEIEGMNETERKRFHHIIIPDLERINARGQKVKHEVVNTLQIFMAEGYDRISTYYIKLNFGKERFRLGVIACTTPDDISTRKSIFRTASFISRLIPFSYDFSFKQKIDILEYIKTEGHQKKEKITIPSRNKVEVQIPLELKDKITPYAQDLAHKVDWFTARRLRTVDENKKIRYVLDVKERLLGTRAEEMFLCYLKSIAYANNRTIVNDEDMLEFQNLYRFFNFNLNNLHETSSPEPLNPSLIPEEVR